MFAPLDILSFYQGIYQNKISLSLSLLWFIHSLSSRISIIISSSEIKSSNSSSTKNNRIFILGTSILLHLVMNGMIYANELELLHFSDSLFIFCYSVFVIVLGGMGIRTLSMTPKQISNVKEILSRFTIKELESISSNSLNYL